MVKHVDVGEKIGGARKDFYARSLRVSDYEQMNDEERKVLVVKKNIFPTVDFKSWRQAGISPHVGMCVKLFRQMLPDATPNEFITEFGSVEEGNRKWIEALNFLDQKLTRRGTLEEEPYKILKDMVPVLREIGNDWISLKLGESQTDLQKAVGLAVQVSFDKKPRAEIPQILACAAMLDVEHYMKYSTSNYLIRAVANQSEEDRNKTILKEIHDRVAIKVGRGEAAYFNTQDESIKNCMWDKVSKVRMVSEATKQKIKEAKEKQELWHRPHLERVEVAGQRRDLHRHVSAEELMQEFGFRAVEFGNWLPQDERQDVLDFAYDSFDQLSEALDVPRKAIGLQGKLAVAFGSRGHGGKNSALAHYEPMRQVINLTRLKGAGCLAHEWFHALDHSLGWASGKDRDVYEPLISRNRGTEEIVTRSTQEILEYIHDTIARRIVSVDPEKIRSLVDDCMKFSLTQCEVVREDILRDNQLETIFENDEKGNAKDVAVYRNILKWSSWGREEVSKTNRVLKTRFGELNEIFKNSGVNFNGILNHLSGEIVKAGFCLAAQSRNKTLKEEVETQFYKDAQRLDADKGGATYWATKKEMYARAGACYVHDRLLAMNARNDYLVYGAEDGRNVSENQDSICSPNTRGIDRIAANAMFDKQVGKWREQVKSLKCEPIVQRSTPVAEMPKPVFRKEPKPVQIIREADLYKLRENNQANNVGEFSLMQPPLVVSVNDSEDSSKFVVQTFDDASMEQGGIVEYQLLPKADFHTAVENGRLMVEGQRISALAYEENGKEVAVKKEDEAFVHCNSPRRFDEVLEVAEKNFAIVWMDKSNQQAIKDILEENQTLILKAVNRNLELKEQTRIAGRKGR